MSYEEIVREIARLHKDNPAAGEVCWRIVMNASAGVYTLGKAVGALKNALAEHAAAFEPPTLLTLNLAEMEDLEEHVTDPATARAVVAFFKPLL